MPNPDKVLISDQRTLFCNNNFGTCFASDGVVQETTHFTSKATNKHPTKKMITDTKLIPKQQQINESKGKNSFYSIIKNVVSFLKIAVTLLFP